MSNDKKRKAEKNLFVCPACGYSFRSSDIPANIAKLKCPRCSYEFANSFFDSFTPDFRQKKI